MIIQLFSVMIIAGLTIVFGWLPTVTVLPWGIDGYLSTGVGYIKGFSVFFPFINTAINAFLIYMGFRLLLIVLKFVLGSRTPSHD